VKNKSQFISFLFLLTGSLTAFHCFSLPQAGDKKELSYQEAFEAGRRVYLRSNATEPSFAHRNKIPFDLARDYFRRALELAKSDREKAEAILAAGEMQLYDGNETGWPYVRKGFESLFELPSLKAEEKARAYMGIGETFLREKNCISARGYFQKAGEAGLAGPARLATAVSFIMENNYPAARLELEGLLEEKEIDATVSFPAKSYIYAIDLLPRINMGRPRLFFNAETWPAVKKRALEDEKDYFIRIKKQVEQLEPWELKTGDYGIQLMTAAFVYRVTGDEATLEKTRKMFRLTLDYYLSRKVDNIRSYSRIATATALDWLWDDLSVSERSSFASDLLDYAYTMYLEDKIQKRLDHQPWYYIQSMFWYTGLSLLDKELDDIDRLRVLTLLGQGYHCTSNLFAHMTDVAGDDGAWHLKPDYAFAHIPTVFWTFAHTWRSATGEDIPGEWIHIVNPDYALRNYLGKKGNAIRHFGYARSWGTKTNGPSLYYSLMNHFLHFFSASHPGYASIAHHLSKRIETEFEATWKYSPEFFAGIFPVNTFLLTGIDNVPPPVIPAGMPVARHFEHGGLVLMSSGFGEKDTYALFSAGGGKLSSDDYDTTHFSIYKQGDMALDSGSGNIGLHTSKYAQQTVAHNAVLIHMPGEKNYGGQDKLTRFAKVLAFETSPYFSYVATDATETCHPDKCKQMVRQFIYLNPDHFLVFDRVISAKAEYNKEWLLHTSNEPVIEEKTFTADQGRGRIFCRTLYPQDAVIEKIGGPGKEFWASGQNWMPPQLNFSRLDIKGSEVYETMGRWRVEVRPGSSREEDVFLHFIQVSDKTVEDMTESVISDNKGKLTVSFSAGGRTYNITLNKTGDIGGNMKIIQDGKIMLDRPLTSEIMSQSGLALKR